MRRSNVDRAVGPTSPAPPLPGLTYNSWEVLSIVLEDLDLATCIAVDGAPSANDVDAFLDAAGAL
jgi:hypothetical protein